MVSQANMRRVDSRGREIDRHCSESMGIGGRIRPWCRHRMNTLSWPPGSVRCIVKQCCARQHFLNNDDPDKAGHSSRVAAARRRTPPDCRRHGVASCPTAPPRSHRPRPQRTADPDPPQPRRRGRNRTGRSKRTRRGSRRPVPTRARCGHRQNHSSRRQRRPGGTPGSPQHPHRHPRPVTDSGRTVPASDTWRNRHRAASPDVRRGPHAVRVPDGNSINFFTPISKSAEARFAD